MLCKRSRTGEVIPFDRDVLGWTRTCVCGACVWCVCGTREGQGSRRWAACSSTLCHTGHSEDNYSLHRPGSIQRTASEFPLANGYYGHGQAESRALTRANALSVLGAGFGEANPRNAGAGEGSLIKQVCDTANATQWTDHTFSGRRREIVCIADGWSRSHLEQSYSTVNTSPRCQMLVITALRKQGSHANVKCKHATPTLLCFSAQSSTIERLENTPFLRTLFLKLLANIRQPHNKYTCTFSQTNPLLHVGLVSAKIFMTNIEPPECPARHDVFGDTPRGTIPLEVPGAAGRWGTA